MKRTSITVGLLLVPLAALAGDAWRRAFQEAYSSPNSWERAAAVKALDADQLDQQKQVLLIGKDGDWYQRFAAIETLVKAKPPTKAAAAELKAHLAKGDPLVAEVVATAFGKMKDKARIDDLTAALKASKEPRVRRACAIALGEIGDPKAIPALMEEVDRDADDWATVVHALEALAKITGDKDKRTVAHWKEWFKKKDAKKPAGGAEAKSAEETQGRFAGAQLRYACIGSGPPVLVLPDYSYEARYFERHMRKLEERFSIIYMHLPGVKDFEPALPSSGYGVPYYPLDRIVDAFEEMRLALVKEKRIEDKPFTILAHGLSAWIALRYAKRHKDGVSRIAISGALPSDTAFWRSISEIAKTARAQNDLELAHYGKWREYVGGGKSAYNPQGQDEWLALWRKGWTIDFGDQQELEIGRLFGELVTRPNNGYKFPELVRDAGGCLIPTFDVQAEPPLEAKLLVCVGEKAFFGSKKDAEDTVKKARNAKIESFKGGSMPWIDDTKHFHEVFEKFAAD